MFRENNLLNQLILADQRRIILELGSDIDRFLVKNEDFLKSIIHLPSFLIQDDFDQGVLVFCNEFKNR